MLQPLLTALLAEISLSYLKISPYLKFISTADIHTSSYYKVICKVVLSGLINQNLSPTICFLELLHGLTVEWYLPLKRRSQDWTFSAAVVKRDRQGCLLFSFSLSYTHRAKQHMRKQAEIVRINQSNIKSASTASASAKV